MAHQKDTLAKRILSSLILAPLVIAAVFYGDWPYHMLLALLLVLSVHEWGMMVRRLQKPFVMTLLGFVYLLICFTSFVIVRADPVQGLTATLILLIAVWASDIGAYILGKTFGRTRIAPRISPGKTYAGLAGAIIPGALVPPLAALLGHSLLHAPDMQAPMQLSFVHIKLALIGFFIGISGQCGDFLISYMKRKAGVKDSGTVIPGHGGVLDRIDALLLAGPVYLALLKVFV